MKKLRIIVSGGGTGGHIYPAITIIENIKKIAPETEFLYVGTQRGLEADIVPRENIPFKTIELSGLERHFTLENIRRLMKAGTALFKARRLVRDFAPDAAIGTGGYVCGPIILAASLHGVPTLIQEQNVVPGITNKILSRFARKIALGAKEAAKHFPKNKVLVTGNPIRQEVIDARREDGLKAYGFDGELPVVLISGGSRGARSINTAMVGVLKSAQQDKVQYLLATGKNEYDSVMAKLKSEGVDLAAHPNLKVVPYLYDMPQAMAMADLAVFRAGATGLAELTAKGVPAILVPYPYAAENHQEHNARAVEKAGAARVILNKDLNSDGLYGLINELIGDREKLAAMKQASLSLGKPQAAKAIAEEVIELAQLR